MRVRRWNQSGIETILAALLLVVIVVVMSVMVYSWSLGIFGSALPVPPSGKEIFVLENQAFPSNSNMTLFLRNTGTAMSSFVSYYVQDLYGNQCSKTTGWQTGLIAPGNLAQAYLAIPAPPSNYCTWNGTPFTYQKGNGYVITLITARNNQFSFTILR